VLSDAVDFVIAVFSGKCFTILGITGTGSYHCAGLRHKVLVFWELKSSSSSSIHWNCCGFLVNFYADFQ